MGRPRTITDDQVLEGARRCFLAHGPSVSTMVIAKEVGLSQAALFQRFGTKDGLLWAALAPSAVPDWVVMAAEGPSAGPLPPQLEALAVSVCEHFDRVVPCMVVLRARGFTSEEIFARYDVSPPLQARQAMTDFFERAMARGQVVCGDPIVAALLFLSPLHHRSFLAHCGGGGTGPEVADYAHRVVQTLWAGLSGEAG